MKKLALAVAALMVATTLRAGVPASFKSALSAYNGGQHQSAREAFLRMARDGRPEAQFNLAVMQARGEGGPVKMAEAVLWATLASEAGHATAGEALAVITAHLADDERVETEERLPSWRADFSAEALFEKHRPVFCADCRQREIDTRRANRDQLTHKIGDGSLRVDTVRPRYPLDAASNRVVGYVELGGWVDESGVLEAAHVISSEPEGVFDHSALEALTRWDFQWQTPWETREPFPLRQTIIFTLDEFANNHRLERRLRHDLRVGLDEAEHNAMPAYRAAYTLEFIGHSVDSDHPARLIELAELAARQGAVVAQREVAKRIRVGEGVERDSAAELFWLKQAAYAGDAVAQYELSFRSDKLGESVARDFGEEARASGYAPAILAAIREETSGNEAADSARLKTLMEALPTTWRERNADDPLLERALAQTQ